MPIEGQAGWPIPLLVLQGYCRAQLTYNCSTPNAKIRVSEEPNRVEVLAHKGAESRSTIVQLSIHPNTLSDTKLHREQVRESRRDGGTEQYICSNAL